VGQVLVLCDQRCAMVVFETDTLSLVKAIEVFDSCNDRICTIVRSDYYPQRQPSTMLWGIGQQELEVHRLRSLLLDSWCGCLT